MIPDFQSMMMPFLNELADGREHSHRDLIAILARRYGVTEEENMQVLPNGQTVFENRVYWAKVHLGKQQLVETPKKGHAKITDLGRAELARLSHGTDPYPTLASEPEPLPTEYASAAPTATRPDAPARQTPEEQMEAIWRSLEDQTGDELLAQVKAGSPRFFEELVVDVLVAAGYGGSWEDAKKSVVGRSGDGGIDAIINQDRLGLDVIHVQAKRWAHSVGRPEVQAFAGSLDGVRARKGIFITTSTFTQGALDYVDQIEKRIVLIDGRQLVRLMLEHGVGVTTAYTYELKRIDSDYFERS